MNHKACLSILSTGAIHNIPANYDPSNHTLIEPSPALSQDHNTKLSALFPKAPMRRIPLYARMGLLACADALENHDKLDTFGKLSHESIGLVVGTAYAGIKMSMDFMDSILDAEPRLSSPTAFSHAVNNMGAGLLSLYLGLQGPCHTVTQFSLSFAGALQAAHTLIYSERASHVLVGCMDESDKRFSQICPNKGQFEGAVFLLVCKETATLPKVCVNFNEQAKQDYTPQSSLYSAVETLNAILAKEEKSILCQDHKSNQAASIFVGARV